jgi:hypothetical protein
MPITMYLASRVLHEPNSWAIQPAIGAIVHSIQYSGHSKIEQRTGLLTPNARSPDLDSRLDLLDALLLPADPSFIPSPEDDIERDRLKTSEESGFYSAKLKN